MSPWKQRDIFWIIVMKEERNPDQDSGEERMMRKTYPKLEIPRAELFESSQKSCGLSAHYYISQQMSVILHNRLEASVGCGEVPL